MKGKRREQERKRQSEFSVSGPLRMSEDALLRKSRSKTFASLEGYGTPASIGPKVKEKEKEKEKEKGKVREKMSASGEEGMEVPEDASVWLLVVHVTRVRRIPVVTPDRDERRDVSFAERDQALLERAKGEERREGERKRRRKGYYLFCHSFLPSAAPACQQHKRSSIRASRNMTGWNVPPNYVSLNI